MNGDDEVVFRVAEALPMVEREKNGTLQLRERDEIRERGWN